VIDPTKNVLGVVAAAVQRLDDLRDLADKGLRDLIQANAAHAAELREAEAKRIDAIRAVDVGAVNRAAEVAAQQALTLSTQTQTMAETLRTQASAAATSYRTELLAALEPMQKDIADLRRVQYEQAGSKAQVVDTRATAGEQRATSGQARDNLGALLGGLAVLISLAMFIVIVLRG